MKTAKKIGLGIMVVLLTTCIVAVVLDQTEKPGNPQMLGDAVSAGDFRILLKLNPEKPKIGKNQLTITLRDSKNQPVTDANIQIYAEMPAMGSMPVMREPVTIENSGSGLYQGRYSLPMNGSWPLTVIIESSQRGTAELLFDMNTSRGGVNLMQATPSKQSPQQSRILDSRRQLKAFTVDSYRRQLIGVTTAEVVCQQLLKSIRAGARVTYDESRLTDITLKYDAWIGEIHADYLGKSMRRGETLFTVYSPDLVSVQNEYLDSLQQDHSIGLRKAARKKLALWDIDAAQIKALQQRSRSSDYLPILSPVNGTIIEKKMVAGSAVKAGTKLLRLADLSNVWVEGEVYESDLPWLKVGMDADITLMEQPELSYKARLTFIDPVLNLKTRSAVIRAELANDDGALRPGMYATMNLQVNLGERLLVPEQSVVHAGNQRIVFVDQGHGRILPKKIKTGLRNVDMIEVQEGLSLGDVIVTSGNFLIAAESKLKAGLAQW